MLKLHLLALAAETVPVLSIGKLSFALRPLAHLRLLHVGGRSREPFRLLDEAEGEGEGGDKDDGDSDGDTTEAVVRMVPIRLAGVERWCPRLTAIE